MKKVLLSVALVATAALPAFAQETGTIVDVAASNPDFSTLVTAIEAAGLAEALSGEGPFTVFAPTNEAFEALPAGALEYLLANPDVLATVLQYHVADGLIMAADVMAMEAPMDNEMMAGGMAMVDPMALTVDGANIIMPDVVASNGVIHAIDMVLLPDLSGLVMEVDPLSVTGDINIAGSSTVGPLTEALAERFSEDGYSGIIANAITGTGGGFQRFCETGETDIANASRPIRDSEIAACAALDTPRTPIEFFVGVDALAVVVAEANDFVTDLTLAQLSMIFTGEATTWGQVIPEVAGTDDDQPIQLFSPGTDSGTFDYFVESVLQNEDGGNLGDGAEAAILNAPGIQFSENDSVLVQGVEGSPYAIGYFGYAYYINEQDRLNAVTIEGVEPNATTAENGEYPLARPLFVYSDATILAERPQVASFINYFLTNVNDSINEVGYFPASRQALRTAQLNLIIAQSMMMEGM